MAVLPIIEALFAAADVSILMFTETLKQVKYARACLSYLIRIKYSYLALHIGIKASPFFAYWEDNYLNIIKDCTRKKESQLLMECTEMKPNHMQYSAND